MLEDGIETKCMEEAEKITKTIHSWFTTTMVGESKSLLEESTTERQMPRVISRPRREGGQIQTSIIRV